MTENSLGLDPERQAMARRYAQAGRAAALAAAALGFLYLVAWALGPWPISVRGAWTQAADRLALPQAAIRAISLLGVAFTVSAPLWIASIPLAYYAGYILPHRFGLSNQTPGGWITDRLKSLVLTAGIGSVLLLGLYALIHLAPRSWWWWAALAGALVSLAMTVLGPVVFMPLFYRMRPLGQEYAEIAARLERLAAAAGVRVQGVFSLDLSRRTKTANAMLVGMGKGRRILVGDTLLEAFEADETESVFAHELAHHVHNDSFFGLLVPSAVMAASFGLMQMVLARMVAIGYLTAPDDPAGLPVVELVWATTGLLTAPVMNAYSRWREARADEFAFRLTGNAPAFARAMIRLGNQNLAEAEPPAWAVSLFGTHPPLGQRIRRAQAAAEIPHAPTRSD
ncbi:MAG TPA: M48 family metalloprotease [Anaerolineales bacterium]|nr:M48 family metalloprotease [Anaerolineales bacterium]